MMQKIIDDAKAMEADALRSEEEGQAAYEQFTRDTTASLDQKNRDIVQKSEQKAKAEKDLVTTEASRDQILSEVEALNRASLSSPVRLSPRSCSNPERHSACAVALRGFLDYSRYRPSWLEWIRLGRVAVWRVRPPAAGGRGARTF